MIILNTMFVIAIKYRNDSTLFIRRTSIVYFKIIKQDNNEQQLHHIFFIIQMNIDILLVDNA